MLPQPRAVCHLLARGGGERPVEVGEHAVLLDDDPAVVAARAPAQNATRSTSPSPSAQNMPRRHAVSVSARSAFTRRDDVEPRVLDVHGADPVAPVVERARAGRRRRRAGARSRAAAARRCPRGSARSPARPRRRSTCDGGRPARSRARERRPRRARRRPRARASACRRARARHPRPGFATRSGPPASHSTGRASRAPAASKRSSVSCSPARSCSPLNATGTNPPTSCRSPRCSRSVCTSPR